jgi:hypothetical protein
MAGIERRIAEYLELNGFADLEEAADREWGDMRPLEVHPDRRTGLCRGGVRRYSTASTGSITDLASSIGRLEPSIVSSTATRSRGRMPE